MPHYPLLVCAVIVGGMSAALCGAPSGAMAALILWPVFSAIAMVCFTVIYVAFFEWWLKDIHPSLGIDTKGDPNDPDTR